METVLGDYYFWFARLMLDAMVDMALEVIDMDLNDYADFACKNAPSNYEESARVLLAGALTISKAAVLKLKEAEL